MLLGNPIFYPFKGGNRLVIIGRFIDSFTLQYSSLHVAITITIFVDGLILCYLTTPEPPREIPKKYTYASPLPGKHRKMAP